MRLTVESTIAALQQHGLPDPVPEFQFAPPRRWRFDHCWPDYLLAWEVDGGVYTRGRHTRGRGYETDCQKLNEALLRGWRVLRTTTGQVASGAALGWLLRALGVEEA